MGGIVSLATGYRRMISKVVGIAVICTEFVVHGKGSMGHNDAVMEMEQDEMRRGG